MSRATGRRRPVNWQGFLGLLISALFLYIALRGVDPKQVLHEFEGANPWWLLLATFNATATIAVRAWRWKPLLEPIVPSSRFRSRFAGTFIRFAVNNIFPARIGEFAGAYSLSRMEPVSASGSFGSLVVERILDAAVVAALLFLSMAMPGFPRGRMAGSDLIAAARLVLVAVVVALIALLIAVLWPEPTLRVLERVTAAILPERYHRRVMDEVRALIAGMTSVRSPILLLRASWASIIVWVISALGFVFGLKAFHIHVPLAGALFLQTSIAMAVAIPAAPGFFGVFEGAARVGLVDLFGINVNQAVGFAIGMHLIGFIPVTAIGMYYFWRLGLTFQEVEAGESQIENAVEREAAPSDGPEPPA